MFEVTELAGRKLREYLDDNNIDSAVRVAVMNSCAGPSLALMVDTPKDTDSSAEVEGVTVVIDNKLMTDCEAVTVDFIEASPGSNMGQSGFNITSKVPLPGSGGGCGGSCSSGSCC